MTIYLHNIYVKLQWNPVHNNSVVSVQVKFLSRTVKSATLQDDIVKMHKFGNI